MQSELVTELSPYMNAQMTEPLDQYNPLFVLSQSYEMLKDYDKAIATMHHIAEAYSRVPGIGTMVEGRVSELEFEKNRADSTFIVPRLTK